MVASPPDKGRNSSELVRVLSLGLGFTLLFRFLEEDLRGFLVLGRARAEKEQRGVKGVATVAIFSWQM